MDSSFVTSLNLLGLHPLGTAGDRSYARLSDVLQTRLSHAHALLLAEPVPSPDGSRIDWYIPGQTRAIALASLPEDKRTAIESRLEELQQGVFALADSLPDKDPSSRALAIALRNAMSTPGPECYYAIPLEDGSGWQPVLIGWSHTRDGSPAYTGSLIAKKSVLRAAEIKVAAPPPPAAVVPPAQPAPMARDATSSFPWKTLSAVLLWLFFLLIVLMFLWQLLRACGITGLPWISSCRTELYANLETTKLMEIVQNLEQQIAIRNADCDQSQNPVDEATRRVEERGGRTGRLQFTLIWEGHADLDLEIVCPSGETIRLGGSGCGGGVHDVDANFVRVTSTPVENVTWTDKEPPKGQFKINVKFFGTNSEPISRVPYSVIIRDGDRQPQTIRGELANDGKAKPFNIHNYSR